jgi:FKBP-type peptidyl-prolyl cis-trans isomerase
LRNYYPNLNKKINFKTKQIIKSMKRILIAAAALLMVAGLSTSCGKGQLKGFKKTETGLLYKYHVEGEEEKAQMGEIVVAEIWVYLGDSLQFTNAGAPEPMFQVMESQHAGDLMEALMMVGKGDSITFAFDMDTLRKYNPGMPEDGNKHLLYTIKVDGVYTQEEFEAKQASDNVAGEAAEAEKLTAYIQENGITAKPTADGVYVIVEKQGTGAVAANGKNVSVNYTGRLLDGKVFDTSLESVAKENGLPARPSYEPLPFTVGAGQMIPGFDKGVEGMKVGTKARLILPSKMAYGSRNTETIPGFSTLIFDIEVMSVN